MLYCSVNGQQINHIAVNDRGFAYGDGIFTTGKISAGKIERLPLHLQRLNYGCEQLMINKPDLPSLEIELNKVAELFDCAVIKVIITSGTGGRGYSRVGVGTPTIVINVFEFPQHYHQWQAQGIHLGVSKQRLGINPMLKGLKHLNRLEQVLLRKELDQQGEDDLLVLNVNEQVVETTCANIFWFNNGCLYTPDITFSGVAGVMRDSVLTVFKNTCVKNFTLSDLHNASSMFICNSVMGIVPVNKFIDKALPIKDVMDLQRVFNNKANLEQIGRAHV